MGAHKAAIRKKNKAQLKKPLLFLLSPLGTERHPRRKVPGSASNTVISQPQKVHVKTMIKTKNVGTVTNLKKLLTQLWLK